LFHRSAWENHSNFDAGNARSVYNNSVDVPGKLDRFGEAARIEALHNQHAALERDNNALRSELEKLHSVQGNHFPYHLILTNVVLAAVTHFTSQTDSKLITVCAVDANNAEREHLKGELQGYAKERQALKVIVDQKIKLFVAEIIKSLDSMQIDESAKVRRQSKALLHLVDSTAAALHSSWPSW
jgi:hypothetical protein